MRRLKAIVLGALAGIMLASSAHAQPPPMLSLKRAAVGPEVAAQWAKDSTDISALAGAWVSYSVTENLAAAVAQRYNFEAKELEPAQAGLRMYVPNDPVRVALGVNYLHDWRDGGHSWSVGLYAGWKLGTRLAATAAVERDVPNDLITYRVGARALAWGGK